MTPSDHIYPFVKMHGLGNDFAIFDARSNGLEMTDALARSLADRRRGIGCDQLIVLRSSRSCDVFMEIWNTDGSRVGACGNATRCVGQLMLEETGAADVSIETDAGQLSAIAAGGKISVNMGQAATDWSAIPLARDSDTNHVFYQKGPLADPSCVNMGNPHAIFFVEDVDAIDLEKWGPEIESDALFPQRVNVSVITVTEGVIRQRVWERGAGITEACGSAACASVVAASRRELIKRKAVVQLDGGELEVEWLENGTVQMTGPATFVFSGEVRL